MKTYFHTKTGTYPRKITVFERKSPWMMNKGIAWALAVICLAAMLFLPYFVAGALVTINFAYVVAPYAFVKKTCLGTAERSRYYGEANWANAFYILQALDSEMADKAVHGMLEDARRTNLHADVGREWVETAQRIKTTCLTANPLALERYELILDAMDELP